MRWFPLKISYVAFCVFFYPIAIAAQNLVENPSFEEFGNCPVTLGNLAADVMQWDTPTNGSTDYFNGCSQAMGTPKNFNGEQPANFGVGYVGLYLYAPEDYREYIQGRLKKKLNKDQTYKVSFYVSLAERSDFAIKEFGIQFLEKPIQVATRKTLSRMHLSKIPGDVSNYFEIRYSDFYSDKKEWVLVEQEFVANGTEKYLIIGNFKNNKRTQKFKTKRNTTKGSYYYLDMVSVARSREATAIKNDTSGLSKTKLIYEVDKINVFKNVLFNFDQYELLATSRTELELIAEYLEEHELLNITINGHTDAIGSEAYNKVLSKNRAKAVALFLIQQGIAKDRISHRGYGSTKPLKENTSNDNRQKNRRVEFLITN